MRELQIAGTGVACNGTARVKHVYNALRRTWHILSIASEGCGYEAWE